MNRMLACFKLLDSTFYQSPVIYTKARGGKRDAPSYLNAVVCIQCPMSPGQMHQWCKEQESHLGRGQYARAGECEADLDLLASWNDSEHRKMPSLANISEDYYRRLVQLLWKNNTV